MTIEKMKQWLKALEEAVHYTSAPVWSPSMTEECNEAITSLRQAIAEAERQDQQIDQLILERDHAHEIIDKLCDAVLGADRHEWSSMYFFEDAVRDVEERMAEAEKQEPVAWVNHGENRITRVTGWDGYGALFARPLQRKPLTMQPIIKDDQGVLRFKKNCLVDALYEHGTKTGLDLNKLHRMNFTEEDRQQFAQLIGYSLSGYRSLSYVTDEAYEAATDQATPPQRTEQEPVAWQVMVEDEAMKEFPIKDMAHDWCLHQKLSGSPHSYWIRPLYTHPPQPGQTSAERTLKSLGYTDNGGEYWKPPLGAWPPQPKQEPVAMREALKKLARFLDVVRVYAQEIRPIHELETDKPLHWKAREIQDEVIRLINTIPQQEPIHWIAPNFEFLFSSTPQHTEQELVIDKSAAVRIATALGWEPKREWVGLTDEEIQNIAFDAADRESAIIQAESKLKQKNGY